MKNQFRNAVILAVGASCLWMSIPQAIAATQEADAPKHKRKEGAAPTAATLVADMQKSVAFIAKSAKEKISTKSKEAVPFWAALRDSSKAIDLLEAGVKANDENTLKGLDALGLSLHQLAASWGVLRASDEGSQVGRGVIALSKAYEVFLFHFGPSVARKHMGGEVTAEEKTQLAAARAEVVSLKAQFASVKDKVKPKSYQKRFIQDTLRLCKEIEEIKGDALKDYCAYIFQYNRLIYTAVAYNMLIDVWYPETAKEMASSWGFKSGNKPTLAFEKCAGGYYKDWKYASVPVTKYGNYYEVTYCVSSITEIEETTFESYSESYSEVTATEVSSEEYTSIHEETSVEEEDSSSFAEEVADGTDDEDGDGILNEEDKDNDNDGTANDDDTDDDNDGVMDSDDADEDSSADEGDNEDSNDDGSADDSGGDDGDDGGGGGDDGGGGDE